MDTPKIVIVTGANRGLGLETCRQILTHHSPVKLYACSRRPLPPSLLLASPGSEVIPWPLDITSPSSIATLVSHITTTTSGHIDVLINNAGTTQYTSSPPLPASEFLKTNYHGTLSMCLSFLPLLSTAGRIVNVSSVASSLAMYPASISSALRDQTLTLTQIDEVFAEIQRLIDTPGTDLSKVDRVGYYVSKAGVNAATAVLARENPDVTINCCCPGWCDTDMGRVMGRPPKSVKDGARIVVRLGFGEDVDGISGKYWANAGVGDTGLGEVVEW